MLKKLEVPFRKWCSIKDVVRSRRLASEHIFVSFTKKDEHIILMYVFNDLVGITGPSAML